MFDRQFPGVVMGLAWTAMGGASLYIETSSVCAYGDRSCRLNSSGMGPVMEESTKIAHTFARSKLHTTSPDRQSLRRMKCICMSRMELRLKMERLLTAPW